MGRLEAAGKAEGEAVTGEVRLEEAGTMWFLVER